MVFEPLNMFFPDTLDSTWDFSLNPPASYFCHRKKADEGSEGEEGGMGTIEQADRWVATNEGGSPNKENVVFMRSGPILVRSASD